MDVPSFEPKGSQMVIYCEGFCPFWPFSVCDIGFPLPPVFLCCSSVYLNSRPNQIKKLKKLWWNVLLFFGVSCICGVVALHSNHSQWYFGSTKLEEIFLESPWTLGGTQKVLTSSLPWLLVGRPMQMKRRVIFVSNGSWSKGLDAKWMDEYP